MEIALSNLKRTQNQLVQSEKMASLGELTAGIAHEIQNPLNFVNNFSEVNSEMLEELKEELDKGNPNEAKAIAEDLIDNENKIKHHGERADSIVKGMLMHSRTGSGEKELTDLNLLADEYLRLAYHGMRAKDKSFNAEFKTNFEESLPKVSVVPQDIGRVLLNLINNALYAADKKAKENNDEFRPEVVVSTKKEDGKVVITVSDNGQGSRKTSKKRSFSPSLAPNQLGPGRGWV